MFLDLELESMMLFITDLSLYETKHKPVSALTRRVDGLIADQHSEMSLRSSLNMGSKSAASRLVCQIQVSVAG